MSGSDHRLEIPAHVPAELVGSHPLVLGNTTEEDPFERIIPDIHKGPAAVYVPGGCLGMENAWFFRRAKDLQAIFADTEHIAVKDAAPFAKLMGEHWQILPVDVDPPIHTHFRIALNPLFSPRRMAAMEERVRHLARHYIEKFKNRGECEFVSEFALSFPIAVFLELIDLPLSELDTFLKWERGLLHDPNVQNMIAATRATKEYLLGVIEERKKNPGEDLISFALGAKVDGRPWTEEEVFGFAFNMFLGGLDTVSSSLGLQFRHLAARPDHQNYLRENPDKIPVAIEEMFRAYAAALAVRTCVKAVEIGGVHLMPGDKIVMTPMVANRDPDEYANPNEVILDRNPRSQNFGFGPHRCLGAPLARREVIIAYREFLGAIPEFSIAPNAKITTELGNVIQLDRLPLVWGGAKRGIGPAARSTLS